MLLRRSTQDSTQDILSLDLSIINRSLRLEIINAFLVDQGLLPLVRLGDASKGELEFIGINDFQADPFVSRVDFKTKSMDKVFNHLCLMSPASENCSGTMIVPIVNNKYILAVEQFRPTVGEKTFEIPRGFLNLDLPTKINNSFGNALRELSEETGLDQSRLAYFPNLVGEVYENTGTSTNKNKVYRIAITLPEDQLNQLVKTNHHDQGEESQMVNTHLIPISETKKWIKDQHSASALWLALD